MTAPKWHEGRAVGFDTETTAPNPHEARIVQAAIVHRIPGQRPRSITWLIDPGVDIPDEAAQVHGWTTERLRERLAGREAIRTTNDGRDTPMARDGALFEIAMHVAQPMGLDVPLVIANAPYDLTLLEHELQRHGIDTLASRPAGIKGIVDPQVIEKAFDPYRKVKGGCRGGKWKCGGCGAEDKTLGSLALHYGIPHVGAHDATGDALAALRLLPKLAEAWPEIARWKLATLHNHQVTWRRDQANSLRAYFDRAGIEHDGVCPSWPIHGACCAPATEEVGAA